MVRLQAQLFFLLVFFFLHQAEAGSSCTKLRFSFLLIYFFLHKAEIEFFFSFFFPLQQAEATRFGSKLSFSSSFLFLFSYLQLRLRALFEVEINFSVFFFCCTQLRLRGSA
jgi:hypothetical protein